MTVIKGKARPIMIVGGPRREEKSITARKTDRGTIIGAVTTEEMSKLTVMSTNAADAQSAHIRWRRPQCQGRTIETWSLREGARGSTTIVTLVTVASTIATVVSASRCETTEAITEAGLLIGTRSGTRIGTPSETRIGSPSGTRSATLSVDIVVTGTRSGIGIVYQNALQHQHRLQGTMGVESPGLAGTMGVGTIVELAPLGVGAPRRLDAAVAVIGGITREASRSD